MSVGLKKIYLNLPGVLSFIFLLLPILSQAAHPLITDDSGTQGKGKYQLEVNTEFGFDKETDNLVTAEATGAEVAAVVSYGIKDGIDVVLGLPYQWIEVKENGVVTTNADGISDLSLELKWRFFEKKTASFAVKPGLTVPAGDEEKGLGSGRAAYSPFFIATKPIGPMGLHLNLGYIRNENKVDEREDLWHALLAVETDISKKIKLVANIGMDSNPDKASDTDPAFILGGLSFQF